MSRCKGQTGSVVGTTKQLMTTLPNASNTNRQAIQPTMRKQCLSKWHIRRICTGCESAALPAHVWRACAFGHLPAARLRNDWQTNTHILFWTMRTKALIPAGSTAARSVVHGPSCLHIILNASCFSTGKGTQLKCGLFVGCCTMLSYTTFSYNYWTILSYSHHCIQLFHAQDNTEMAFVWQGRQKLATSFDMKPTQRQFSCTRQLSACSPWLARF